MSDRIPQGAGVLLNFLPILETYLESMNLYMCDHGLRLNGRTISGRWRLIIECIDPDGRPITLNLSDTAIPVVDQLDALLSV